MSFSFAKVSCSMTSCNFAGGWLPWGICCHELHQVLLGAGLNNVETQLYESTPEMVLPISKAIMGTRFSVIFLEMQYCWFYLKSFEK